MNPVRRSNDSTIAEGGKGSSRTYRHVSSTIHSAGAREILLDRAKRLAIKETIQTIQKRDQFLQFRLGSREHYGIPYPYLMTIVKSPRLALVPGLPTFVKGIINQRGDMVTVIDLSYFFSIQSDPNEKNSWVLITQYQNMKIGFLAHEVFGDVYYASEMLTAPLPSREMLRLEFIQGLYQGEVALLNIEAIYRDKELHVQQ